MSLVFFLCPFLLKLQSWSEGLRHFVFQVRKMQFKLTLFPLDSVGCYKSTLPGGMGKNLVKAVFMSVFCRCFAGWLQNSQLQIPYKNTWKRGGVPEPFGQDSICPNVKGRYSLERSILGCLFHSWQNRGFLQVWVWFGKLLLRYFDKRVIR